MAAELDGVSRVAVSLYLYCSLYSSRNVPEGSPVSGRRLWESRGPLLTRGGAYDYRLIPYWKSLLSKVRQDRETSVSDPEAPARRSGRSRVPSVRLKPLGESTAASKISSRSRASNPPLTFPADTRPITDGSLDIDSALTAEADVRAHASEVRQLSENTVSSAGGHRSHDATRTATAVSSAIRSLTDPGDLRKGYN